MDCEWCSEPGKRRRVPPTAAITIKAQADEFWLCDACWADLQEAVLQGRQVP